MTASEMKDRWETDRVPIPPLIQEDLSMNLCLVEELEKQVLTADLIFIRRVATTSSLTFNWRWRTSSIYYHL